MEANEYIANLCCSYQATRPKDHWVLQKHCTEDSFHQIQPNVSIAFGANVVLLLKWLQQLNHTQCDGHTVHGKQPERTINWHLQKIVNFIHSRPDGRRCYQSAPLACSESLSIRMKAYQSKPHHFTQLHQIMECLY